MMMFPSDSHNAYVLMPRSFSAIRIFHDTAIATKINLKISCSPSKTLATVVPDKLDERCAEGYKRLEFWFDTILDNVVLVDVASEKLSVAMSLGNPVMFVPGTPTDHLIVSLLHAKLCSILEGYFDIHTISIVTDDTGGIETVYRKVDQYDLPSIKYFPGETLHQTPWWSRDTIEICEFPKGQMTEDQLLNKFSDFFDDSLSNTEAEVIVFGAGKDEDGQV